MTGTGFAGAVSRISGVFLPLVLVYLFDADPYLPYLVFGISAIMCSVVSCILPYDLMGKALDLSEE